MGQLTPQEKPPMYIISGQREVGKTSFLSRLYRQALVENIDVAGVISPAVFEEGKKIGIDLLDPRTGERKRLANLRHQEETGIFTERWAFDSQIMQWGNDLLACSVPSDLLIVDELGPIELEQGKGWQNGIWALNQNACKAALVVIRPELIETALKLWPQAQTLVIGETSDTQQVELTLQIISLCRK
jgi:nucleoside-triphosphatase THEP1